MKIKYLTNERLTRLFVSSCALANFAIAIVRKSIENGTYKNLSTSIEDVHQAALKVEDDKERKRWGIV